MDKIKTIEELTELTKKLQEDGKKIIHCHGVFDLLHIGHIRYFGQARKMGDVLVVTITPDRYVDKGSHRPAFGEILRAEAVASLDCVDWVAINLWPTAEETLRLLRPDVYVKGSEFKDTSSDLTGKIAKEEKVVGEIGAKIAFTEDIVFSSTNLINRYLSNMPKEIDKYLELFRERYTLEELLSLIDNMASLNVLVIGDTIIDEYQYCDAIGMSSKDPALALKYQSHDKFAGGVLAVVNHVANFARSVELVTVIGEENKHENFIRSQLQPNVSPNFWIQPNAPTLIKRRFLDSYTFNKLFEIYVMDDSGLPRREEEDLCNWLEAEIKKYDLIIAADFGHGAISEKVRKILCKNAPFLAINTQANAGNRGFHTLSVYPKADYVCVADHEFRLETKMSNGNLRHEMKVLAKKMQTTKLVVTRGRKGCAVCDNNGGFVSVPAFAQTIIDRVGAGDAFLSVTALATVQNASDEIVGFLGNVVGALAVEIIGNKKAIDKQSVKKYIVSLMK